MRDHREGQPALSRNEERQLQDITDRVHRAAPKLRTSAQAKARRAKRRQQQASRRGNR